MASATLRHNQSKRAELSLRRLHPLCGCVKRRIAPAAFHFYKGDSCMKNYWTKSYAWRLGLVLSSAIALDGSSQSFDWPQWQGPDRNAVSKERGLLKEWPKDGPPLAWEVKGLGGGYSAPSVAAGQIFGMSNRGDGEVVWALSETDGKELWAPSFLGS